MNATQLILIHLGNWWTINRVKLYIHVRYSYHIEKGTLQQHCRALPLLLNLLFPEL